MILKEIFNSEKIIEKLSKFYYEEFNLEVYKSINLDSLLVFGIYMLYKNNLPITEENIYVQTYILFPHRFSLPSYIFFPNTARLNKGWLRCRSDKNLITGTSAAGFSLTKIGFEEASKIENILKRAIIQKSTTDDKRIPGDRAIIQIFKEHNSFIEFQRTNKTNLSEIEFCLLINVRQTASHNLFETRFAELESIFKEYNENALIQFLESLRKKFYYFFIPREEKSSMMKPKKSVKGKSK